MHQLEFEKVIRYSLSKLSVIILFHFRNVQEVTIFKNQLWSMLLHEISAFFTQSTK